MRPAPGRRADPIPARFAARRYGDAEKAPGRFRDIFRIPYSQASGPAEIVGAPGALGNGRGHWTRNIAFAPDGASFFVAVGSQSNINAERAPRATVQRFNLDGAAQDSFASGLRNPVGIAFRPGTDDLYVVVNERDGLGDGLVPDYFTRIRSGEFFGWPYAYSGPHPAPTWGARDPDLVALTKAPDLMFQAHSAFDFKPSGPSARAAAVVISLQD